MFVKSIDGKFQLNGVPYRFAGANVYEMANLEESLTRGVIDDAASMGFKALRFWLFKNRDTAEIIRKMNEICDYVNPLGLKLIVSLADKWGYLQSFNIDESWYKSGYRKEYLPYIKEVTSGLKHRDEVMIWELINEPETGSFENMYNFTEHTGSVVKDVNENHMISLGTVGGTGDKFGGYFSVFKKRNFEKLYSLPSLDAVSLHDYSYDSGLLERLAVLYRFKGDGKKALLISAIEDIFSKPFKYIDKTYLKKNKLVRVPLTLRAVWNSYNKRNIEFSRNAGKPVYIGETGFKDFEGRSRSRIIEIDMEEKFSMGVSGYMLWSFETRCRNNDGHGYGFGMDEDIAEVIKSFNI